MSLDYLMTSFVVILLPGTGVLYTLAVGLGQGFKASAAAAAGCTLGILPAAIASILGVAAIFHTSAIAYQAVKTLGVVYLLFMAWTILRDNGTLEIRQDQTPASLPKTAVTGMLTNVLNPKLSLFFLAFLPQFVDMGQPGSSATLFMLAAVFMSLTFLVFIAYGGCAAHARDYVVSRPAVIKWLKRCFAGTFGFLSVRLALSDQ